MRGIGTSFRQVIVLYHLEGPPAASSIASGTREYGDGDQNHIFFLRARSIQNRPWTGCHRKPPP